ncbi:MAG: biotin transporter BioY [Chloroflexi bacterium]|nr:biotin transporter BioY [Chloroflexota bacterium]
MSSYGGHAQGLATLVDAPACRLIQWAIPTFWFALLGGTRVQAVSVRRSTLVDAVVPGAGIWRDVMLVVGFATFVAVAAQVSSTPPSWFVDAFSFIGIPIQGTPVPITLQTMAVGITGATLGSRRGALSLMVYMAAGIVGLPAFAGAVGQVWSGDVAFGATNGALGSETSFLSLASGGYILGFIAAAYVIGWLAERGWDRNFLRIAGALLIGNVLVYAIGLPWLYVVLDRIPSLGMTLAKTLDFGLWPFVPGDVLKLLVVTGALPGAWALVSRRRS